MPGSDNYKGAVWPVRMNSDGNLERGTRKQTIKSDMRMILKGRRYVNSGHGGDRLMRPGFGSIFINQLIQAFDADVLVPVARSEIRLQLRQLEVESLVRVDSLIIDSPEDGALRAAIGYTDLSSDHRDSYDFETGSEKPRQGGG